MNNIDTYIDNRNSLLTNLSDMIKQHEKSGKKLALMLVKIHRFRRINMMFGHDGGDEVLAEFVVRIRSMCRARDFIARFGNSEFIMVLPEIMNEGHAALAATKLQNSLIEPFNITNKSQKITASIGISIYPDHGNDVTSLIKAAEIALVDARNNPRLFSIYSEEIAGTDLYSLDIETELDKAVDNDELSLYFQPQINLTNCQIYGAEALIRWRHPDKGFIRPDIFIPIAEHSGQIHKLTWWTLNTALRLIKEWPISHSHLKLAINISAKVLKDLSFVDSVRSALKFWNVSSSRLTLEITESALIEDLTTSFITLEELKAMGFGISIDDFGTGYSSMAYFKNIPANELKIDQSFVFYMMDNPMDKHIVTTIIGLAHGFSLNVVAEGIENARTYETLMQLGCDIGQGFHIAKPMPQTEFVNWIIQYRGI